MAQHLKSNRATILLLSFLIIFSLAGIYGQTLRFDFVSLDDLPIIVQNAHIKSFDLHMLQWIITGSIYTNWMPLTYFIFSALHHLFGLNPTYFHLLNLLLHIANTFLLWRLIYVLFGLIKKECIVVTQKNNPHFIISSWAGAFLWSIHPLRVESVAWIIELKDVLFSFFYLLSLYFYLLYLKAQQEVDKNSPTHKNILIIYSFLAFFLSGLSKPMAVTLPAVLFILDILLKRKLIISIILEKTPFILYSFFITLMTLSATQEFRPDSTLVSIFDRVLTAIYGLGFYLEKTILPLNLTAIYFYELDQPSARLLVEFSALSTLLLFLIILLIRKRYLNLSMLFYAITLLPVLGLLQLGSQEVADRFSYIPTIVIFFAVAYFINELLETRKIASHQHILKIIIFFLVLISSFLCFLSYQQTKNWRNSFTLWTHQLTVRADRNTIALIANYYSDRGNHEMALIYYQEGIRLFPNDPDFYILSAITHFKLKNYPASYEFSIKTLQMNPLSVDALKIMWALESDTNKKSELKQKIDRISSLTGAPSLLQ